MRSYPDTDIDLLYIYVLYNKAGSKTKMSKNIKRNDNIY